MDEILTQSRQETIDRACDLAVRASAEEGRCVLLVPTYDETVRVKHELARRGCGFGVDVETLESWAGDLWEMYGDGRRVATSIERALFVRRALKDYRAAAVQASEEPLLELTPGTERLIARIVQKAPGEVMGAARAPENYELSPAQAAVVAVAAQTRRLMAQSGLIELARVCDYLADMCAVRGMRVIACDVETVPAEDRFLNSCTTCFLRTVAETQVDDRRAGELNALVGALYRPDFDNPIHPEGAVRFVYPEGAYASAQLLSDQIVEAAKRAGEGAEIVVATPDAMGLYEALAPRLLAAGGNVSVAGTIDFPKTPFGRAWCALVDFGCDEEVFDVRRAGDFALSAFSSMSVSAAYEADAHLRGWRGKTMDDAYTDLSGNADDDWRDFIDAFSRGQIGEALDAQMRWVSSRMGWSEGFRAQQLCAVQAAQAVHAGAESLGLGPMDALSVLRESTIASTMAAGDTDTAAFAVKIGTFSQIAAYPPCSSDVVVIAGLDAESYPLKDEERAADVLLKALDAWKPARRIERLRLRYAKCVAQARRELLLHRCLHTADAEELRPAALLEELVDCYRRDPRNPDEVSKKTGLTPAMDCYCATLGEDDLSRVLDNVGVPEPLANTVPIMASGDLGAESVSRVLLPGRGADGLPLDRPKLSPSAIESYLECPYKWFASRRLRLEGIDAELGPIAYGNFAHAVLEELHLRLKVTGLRRVTPENLPDCELQLDSVFNKLLAQQRTIVDKESLIPLTEIEALEVEAFRNDLHEFLKWEANLLPDFSPLGQEVQFGDDEPFEYGGMLIHGRIDRVDVDGLGRAVVIDYKGSAGQNYCFFEKGVKEEPGDEGGLAPMILPRKVQTLIYAQVVRRKLGLVPVGALYVGYGKKHGVAGLYSRNDLGPNDLPDINVDRCGTTRMAEILDECEEAIGRRLAQLAAGRIQASPCDEDACEYCPVVLCTARDGVSAKEVG